MDKLLIGVIGSSGSGKDEFCNFLKKHLKEVEFFKFSDPLTEALKLFSQEVSRDNQQWLVHNLRSRFGDDVLVQSLEGKINLSKANICVLNGLRRRGDYDFLKRKGGILIYLTVDEKIRWSRLYKRSEKKDDKVSYENFLKKEKASAEVEISDIGKEADFIIENNGSIEDFEKEILKVVKNI